MGTWDGEFASVKRRNEEKRAYLEELQRAKKVQARHMLSIMALAMFGTAGCASVGVLTNFSPVPTYGLLAVISSLGVYSTWRMEISKEGRVLRDFEMRQKRHEARQRQQDVDAIADEILAEREHAR